MKEAYPQSILLIEGYMGVLRKFRRITPESLNGALFALIQSNIPIVPTIDHKNTATFLVTAAKQLKKEGRETTVIRRRSKVKTLKDKQLYVVTGFPHVGPVLADKMLKKRGSVRKVFCSSKKEFIEVEGVGSLIASGIVEVLDTPYEDEKDKPKERKRITD
jgi:DNA excision repair protein ERCC-4